MKKALAWVLTLALALGAAGCSAPAGEPESTAAPVETPAASGKPQQTQAPEETPGELIALIWSYPFSLSSLLILS